MFGLAAVVAFLLGVWGFRDHGAGDAADWVYYALQQFVLQDPDLTPPPRNNPQLEIARFLGPAATAFALFETVRVMLRNELRRLRATTRRDHAVVCGDGPAAILVARAMRAGGGQ